MRRLAVIDMGSNSFRLVVFGYEPDRNWEELDEIREPVRVAEGAGEDGVLGPEPMERAVQVAKAFSSFCRAEEIDDVTAAATSAIRDAPNGGELLARIRDEAGLEARVLSEQEEARYGYLAVVNSTALDSGYGFDIGGGSVQVMRIEERRLERAGSWPLGAVRMTERFGDDAQALREHVRSVLDAEDWIEAGKPARAAGIGGTIRNLAAAARRRAGVPKREAQGFELTREALGDLVDELAGMPTSERGRVPGIKSDRGDVILAGALVLAELMGRCGVEAVETTRAGLREGIFFELSARPCGR
jgi:exopolyphosphatase / guanosine-5'-triphosphate,3'-diphosphate pyrophosphatase